MFQERTYDLQGSARDLVQDFGFLTCESVDIRELIGDAVDTSTTNDEQEMIKLLVSEVKNLKSQLSSTNGKLKEINNELAKTKSAYLQKEEECKHLSNKVFALSKPAIEQVYQTLLNETLQLQKDSRFAWLFSNQNCHKILTISITPEVTQKDRLSPIWKWDVTNPNQMKGPIRSKGQI